MALKKPAPKEKEPRVSPGLKNILTIVERKLELEAEIAEKTEELKDLQDDLKNINENILPSAMDEEGLEELKLKDGRVLKVAQEVYISIPEAQRERAFAWLRKHGHGGIIKRVVGMKFAKGEDELAAKLAEWFHKKYPDRDIQDEESVHHSTLKAWGREMIEKGEELPDTLFSIFSRQVANLTQVKGGKADKKTARTDKASSGPAFGDDDTIF